MKKILVITIAALSLLAASVGQAADEFPTGTAEPWSYDPDNTGTVVAEWNDAGNILILQKNAPTSTNSAAGATLVEAVGTELSTISFEVRGYCNNGAPRVNIDWDGGFGFFGCARSNSITALPDGWTRVEFVCDSAVGVPEEATGCGEIIEGAEIVMDEEGQTDLRNIIVNSVFYGPPVPASAPPVEMQQNRAGYCMPNPVLRSDGTVGRFVDLFDGQPSFDSRYAGARYAYYLQGRGISCEIPRGFFLDGTSNGPYPFARAV